VRFGFAWSTQNCYWRLGITNPHPSIAEHVRQLKAKSHTTAEG